MDLLITKEIARAPEKAGALLTTTALLRIPLYLIGLGAVMLYTQLAGSPSETVAVIVAIGVAQLIYQFSFACRASLEGLQRMEYISYAEIAAKAFNTFISIGLLLLGFGVIQIAAVAIGMALINLAMQLVPLNKLQPLKFKFDFALAKWMLKASAPYLTIMAFLVLYLNTDAIVIAELVDERTLGWYSAADNLFGTLLFIPTVFITAVFPILARMHSDEDSGLGAIMNRSFNLLLLLSVPIGLGLFVLATPIVVLIFGDKFVNSGPVLSVLGIVLIIMYQNILLGRFLLSIDRQNVWTVVMGIAVVGGIALDIFLVPWTAATFNNGAIGGALAYICTEGMMLLAGLWLLRENLDLSNVWVAARTFVAGGIMVAAIWPMRDIVLPVPILTGAVVYIIVIVVFKIIPPDDIALVRSLLKLDKNSDESKVAVK